MSTSRRKEGPPGSQRGVGRPAPLVGRPHPWSADLGGGPSRLLARSYGGGEWREGVSLHFSGAKTPLGHLYKEGYPPTLRHTPRSSLSHSSLTLSLGSSSELGIEAESVPDLLSGSSV